MKFIDEFRDPQKALILLQEIQGLVKKIPICRERPLWIMEVCGGPTHTIFRHGINKMLPKEIEVIHERGCPICVLPRGRVDDCIALAERDEVIMITFGDARRVTGSRKNLL